MFFCNWHVFGSMYDIRYFWNKRLNPYHAKSELTSHFSAVGASWYAGRKHFPFFIFFIFLSTVISKNSWTWMNYLVMVSVFTIISHSELRWSTFQGLVFISHFLAGGSSELDSKIPIKPAKKFNCTITRIMIPGFNVEFPFHFNLFSIFKYSFHVHMWNTCTQYTCVGDTPSRFRQKWHGFLKLETNGKNDTDFSYSAFCFIVVLKFGLPKKLKWSLVLYQLFENEECFTQVNFWKASQDYTVY